jgi:hypothetical protein
MIDDIIRKKVGHIDDKLTKILGTIYEGYYIKTNYDFIKKLNDIATATMLVTEIKYLHGEEIHKKYYNLVYDFLDNCRYKKETKNPLR